MRILFINDVYTVGGATKALYETVRTLTARGHECIVCTSCRNEFNEALDALGVQNLADGHWSAMNPAERSASRSLWQAVKQKRRYYRYQCKYLIYKYRAAKYIADHADLRTVDLIHTNSARNDVGCLLHARYGIPHIMHIREFGQEDFGCTVYRPDYYRYLNRTCDLFLAVSDAVRDSWVRKGIDRRRALTFYDGADLDAFRQRPDNGFPEKTLRAVFVGGICAEKGQHIAVKALAMLPESVRRRVTLDFIGWDDPNYLLYLNRLIRRYGLTEQVRFLGSRDDVGELLCGYDLGLMCSRAEGFGRVTAEYMYAGLGVIAADTGASPELVEDGVSGLIYHRDSPRSLAEKMMLFDRDRALLTQCSRRAKRRAAAEFSLPQNMDRLLRIYGKLLRQKSQQRRKTQII